MADVKRKITVTFKDGRRRVLKSPDQLEDIDKTRKALFVMNNLQVFGGYCDGDIDIDGDFCVMNTIHGIGLPFNRLIGWCYETNKKDK